jgi:hypothetical protein
MSNRKNVAAPVSGQCLKLMALSGHASGPFASLAQLGLISAEQ